MDADMERNCMVHNCMVRSCMVRKYTSYPHLLYTLKMQEICIGSDSRLNAL